MTGLAEASDLAELPGLPKDSLTARWAADWRLILLAPSALLLQVAHPVIGSGVAEHSIFKTDPIGRFDRSYWPTLALAFYGDDTAAYGRDIKAMHKPIGGIDHAGRKYHAWEPEAYFFVLATGYFASEIAATRFGPGLTAAQRVELYDGWRRMALLAGLPERAVPQDLPSFESWFDAVLRDRLEHHPSVGDVLVTMSKPPVPQPIPAWLWKLVMWRIVGPLACWVNTGVLPDVARQRLGLTWTDRDERRLNHFATLVRAVDKVLPRPVREITRVVALRRKAEIMRNVRRAADAV
ncbi:oxygenase MpaB family protein [Nocardia sp. XZ_19_385]|uniref:oxygenase MpaB family protein n=1 Tax=Nocardia sp. XZ_19_385 TaxID=2769488 RepID=UPI00189075BE|nr:oxygenase MpaB family protein [Nocardia sp. XZ_19_385]